MSHFNSSNHCISDFVAFGFSIINGGNDCRKTKEMRLIQALANLNPQGKMNASLSVNLLLSWNLFVFLTTFCLTHPYPFISFCFYVPIILRYFTLHRYINTSLFVSHAFTPTKDYSPKRQCFKKFFSLHYDVKYNYL